MGMMEASFSRAFFEKIGTMDGGELPTTRDSLDKDFTMDMEFSQTQILIMKGFLVGDYSAEKGSISGEKR